MDSSLPVGFQARRPTLDDLKPVTALFQANERYELGYVLTTEANLHQRPGYDISQDAWLVLAPGGEIAARHWCD